MPGYSRRETVRMRVDRVGVPSPAPAFADTFSPLPAPCPAEHPAVSADIPVHPTDRRPGFDRTGMVRREPRNLANDNSTIEIRPVISSVMQTDEGGRFMNCVANYRIIHLASECHQPLSRFGAWVSLGTLRTLMSIPGVCSNELRSVASLARTCGREVPRRATRLARDQNRLGQMVQSNHRSL